MKELISSKRFSLFCGVFNTVFAIQSFMVGSWGFFMLCTAFALYCFNNYRQA